MSARLPAVVLGVCWGLAFAEAAVATRPDAPMDPDDAFRPSVRLAIATDTQEGLTGFTIAYRIAPGYYLYRDRIRVSVAAGDLELGAPRFPEGQAKEDAFAGPVRVYRDTVEFDVPIAGKPVPGTYTLRLVAQGCLEERICYAPFTQEMQVSIPPGFQVGDAPSIRPLPRPGRP
jgi:thiol:disulfide interchange protein DsbD